MPGDFEQLAKRDISKLSVSDLDEEADPSALAALPHLRRLAMSNVTPAQLARLSGLRELDTLYLEVHAGVGPVGLASLAGMTKLEALAMQLTLDHEGRAREEQTMTDLRPLANLTQLRKLYLEGFVVSDLAPLARLSKLEELALEAKGEVDLAPLISLPALRIVKVRGRYTFRDRGPAAQLKAKLQTFEAIETSASGVTDWNEGQGDGLQPICDIDPSACRARYCSKKP